jgi:hypothetical protein
MNGLFMNVERSLGFQGFHEYAPDTVNEYEVNVTSFMGERSLGFMNTPHAPGTVNEYEVNVNEYS